MDDLLRRVDELCAASGVTRVAVLYALLGALCPPKAPDAPESEGVPVYIKAAIMRASRARGPCRFPASSTARTNWPVSVPF
jgi:hypothetical protein